MDFDFTTETITPDSTTILTIGGTGALELPSGTTGQEPVSATAGAIRWNTTVPQIEYYNGTVWLPFGGSVTSVQASGGTTGLTFTGGPITSTGTLTLSGTLGTANGGTGATATPTNGQILVGNGTNFVVATLGTGTGISTTVGAGTLQINNTGVTSAVAGTGIGVSAATGAVTFSNTGVLSWSGGTTGLLPSTATTGAVTLTGTLVVSNGGTGATTLTAHGVLLGEGTSPIVATAVGATGTVLAGNTGADPSFTNTPAISGANFTAGSVPIAALAFDTITIGTTTITLGGTSTTLGGITGITLVSGTVTGVATPVNPSDVVPLSYLQNVLAGFEWKEEAVAATTANLPATYNNGASGVGATLTNSGAQAAFTIDGWTPNVGDRVLIKNQTTQTQNGIYVVTNAGSGSTNWVLTRSTDANGSGSPNSLNNATLYITNGTVNENSAFSQTTPNPTVGTSNIVFVQSAGGGTYTAGTGLTLTGNVFSITNVGTASTYGDSTHVPVFTTNAQGQVTAVTNTAIAFPVTSVTGTGAGINVSPTTGAVVVSNTGVTSNVAGTGISVSGATGAVTINNTGVLSFSGGTTGLTPNTATTGAIVLAGTLVATNGGTGTATAPTAGQLLVGVTGGTYIPFTVTSGTGISTTVGSGTFQINNTGVTSVAVTAGSLTTTGATGAITLNLATAGTAGTYGSVTTDTFGRVTAGSVIAAVANGGTGAATFTAHGVLLGEGASAFGVTAVGATGTVLAGNTGADPTFQTLTGIAVTSITGTTNQIAANGVFTAQTGAVTLTTPVVFIAPGSIASTTTITAATGLTLTYATANAFLYSGAASAVLSTAQATNGSLLIGSTGAAPVLGTLTAGINTYITNAAGSITIAGPKYWAESSTAPSTLPSATGNQSIAMGNSAVASRYGQIAMASGSFGTAGDAQSSFYTLRISTANATPAVMFIDGSAARLTLPVNSAWMYDINIVARRTDATGTFGAWNLKGLITQDATVATTTLQGSSRTFVSGSGLVAASVSATADVANGALQINVTGNAAQTIRWVANVRITEVANV